LIMSLLPLATQTLAWLKHAADSGQCEPLALLHLIARADAGDRDVAKFLDHYSRFLDSYSKTIAALCRRMEALEPVAGLRHPVEGDATQSDSVVDAVQRITDHAAKAGLTVQDWARAFSAAPVDDSPVQPEIEVCETCDGEGTINELLVGGATANPAATCPDCDGVGETRRFHRQPQAAPVALAAAPAGGLVEKVASAMGPSTQAAMDAGELPFGTASTAICEVAAWLDTRGQPGCSALLREEIING
jgi:hypothetical protein